ncbi:MAG: NUDIX domain-containing protein [Nostocoides sp.]
MPAIEPPDLSTETGRLAFNRVLNERMPRKRAIAQGLARNEDGEILLCRLTYKTDLDLPGGIVDPKESPADCLVREVAEELGLRVVAGRLLAVNWLPPYRGWDDATLFLFDLGMLQRHVVAEAELLAREIAEVSWVAPERLADLVAPYTAAMVTHVLAHPGQTAYLENSAPRERH